jgi:uncharacterized protein (DUF1697 family)
MPDYAAFLRGINVGARQAKGAQLRSCLERVGLEDVSTFRASGNVVFTDPDGGSADALTGRVEEALAGALGYQVVVFLRTAAQTRAIARHEPFPAKAVKASEGKLQVLLLAKKPAAGARKRALGEATGEDRLAIRGRELYWLPSGRMRDSGLDLKAIEDAIGPTTMRTKGTMALMAEKFFSD